MRTKDENKRKAISDAAINLIHREGFAHTSMSKIAKAAGVSSSTIYVYFDNKEDMLNKLYVYGKKKIFHALYDAVDFDGPIYDIFKKTYYNFYNFMTDRQVIFSFCEQFANSPFINRISKEQVNDSYEQIIDVVKRGINEQVLVDTGYIVILNQLYAPLVMLIKSSSEQGVTPGTELVDDTFRLSWKGIKR